MSSKYKCGVPDQYTSQQTGKHVAVNGFVYISHFTLAMERQSVSYPYTKEINHFKPSERALFCGSGPANVTRLILRVLKSSHEFQCGHQRAAESSLIWISPVNPD